MKLVRKNLFWPVVALLAKFTQSKYITTRISVKDNNNVAEIFKSKYLIITHEQPNEADQISFMVEQIRYTLENYAGLAPGSTVRKTIEVAEQPSQQLNRSTGGSLDLPEKVSDDADEAFKQINNAIVEETAKSLINNAVDNALPEYIPKGIIKKYLANNQDVIKENIKKGVEFMDETLEEMETEETEILEDREHQAESENHELENSESNEVENYPNSDYLGGYDSYIDENDEEVEESQMNVEGQDDQAIELLESETDDLKLESTTKLNRISVEIPSENSDEPRKADPNKMESVAESPILGTTAPEKMVEEDVSQTDEEDDKLVIPEIEVQPKSTSQLTLDDFGPQQNKPESEQETTEEEVEELIYEIPDYSQIDYDAFIDQYLDEKEKQTSFDEQTIKDKNRQKMKTDSDYQSDQPEKSKTLSKSSKKSKNSNEPYDYNALALGAAMAILG